MPIANLKNITLKKLTDRNANTYYLIVNQDNQKEAFFCFEGTINQEGWSELEDNWENLKEVELEYIEKGNNGQIYRKVTSLVVSNFKEAWEVF